MTISKTTAGPVLCASLAALALAAAGCSSSTGSNSYSSSGSSGSGGSSSSATQQSPTQLVQAAYAKTSAAKSAKVAMSGNVGGQTLTGNGVISFADKTSELTITTTQGSIESRTVGGVTYSKLPAQLASVLHNNKPWIKVDNASAGKLGSSLPQPGDFSAYLQGISSSVTKVGTSTVRGTATTHYKAQVDLDKVAAASTDAQKQAITALEKANGTKTFPVEVWLDKDGLVRRVRTSVPLPKASSTGASSGSSSSQNAVVTVEYYDFGTAVNVSAPPASQVTDLKSLLPGTN